MITDAPVEKRTKSTTIYPYLLDNLVIERPNQVWSSDLTYLPMAHGFMYLVAILDVASRKVLARVKSVIRLATLRGQKPSNLYGSDVRKPVQNCHRGNPIKMASLISTDGVRNL